MEKSEKISKKKIPVFLEIMFWFGFVTEISVWLFLSLRIFEKFQRSFFQGSYLLFIPGFIALMIYGIISLKLFLSKKYSFSKWNSIQIVISLIIIISYVILFIMALNIPINMNGIN